METFKIYTLGCKVNQYDTQVIREDFLRRGLKETDNGSPADIYIINTCTVTSQADSKSLTLIRRATREGPEAKIYVTGCLAKLDRKKIKDKFRDAIIFSKDRFKSSISGFEAHHRAFLKIQDGCENFCSYCKVPLVRGELKSRPLEDIINEAKRLVASGFKEIVLCGICLGAYGRDLDGALDIVCVIEQLEMLSGEFRIRLSSIEAVDVNQRLIAKFEASKRLCPHLHIPLQSADARILKLMNRRYTPKAYLDLINALKQRVPLLSITTDVMVGFPSEDETNFQNTLNLLKQIMPLRTHIFPFSPRKGTVAFNLNYLPRHIINQRIRLIKELAQELSFQYRSNFLGKELEVLPEGNTGYTQNYIPVNLKPPLIHSNKLIKVRIIKVGKTATWAGLTEPQ